MPFLVQVPNLTQSSNIRFSMFLRPSFATSSWNFMRAVGSMLGEALNAFEVPQIAWCFFN